MTVKINCNHCGNDLTYTGNSVEYRIAVVVEQMPHAPDTGVVTDLGLSPPFRDRVLHFCNRVCLLSHLRRLEGEPP
jgi:hypothetical protein